MELLNSFLGQGMIAQIGEIVLFANTVTMAMPTRWRGNMMIRTERRKTMHNSDTIKIKIPMVKMVEDILKNLRRVRKLHDKRIFQIKGDTHINRRKNLQLHWKTACQASSVDWNVRPKDLRHFFGSHLLNSGVDPLMITSFMGHASWICF